MIGTIAQITGYFRGAKKAQTARQQFDEITNENQLLTQKLEAAQAQPQKSFTAAIENEREAAATQVPARG